jgi:hypothetical protein
MGHSRARIAACLPDKNETLMFIFVSRFGAHTIDPAFSVAVVSGSFLDDQPRPNTASYFYSYLANAVQGKQSS